MTDSVNAGADDVKRANCGSKLEQWRAMQESGCNVATLQHHDVPTSRRFNVATLGQPIQKSTIKNVVTSQRRDVSTSRRLNVATSQRRDVATSRRQHEIYTSSFKAPMVQKSGHREAYELGHGIPEHE